MLSTSNNKMQEYDSQNKSYAQYLKALHPVTSHTILLEPLGPFIGMLCSGHVKLEQSRLQHWDVLHWVLIHSTSLALSTADKPSGQAMESQNFISEDIYSRQRQI